MKATEEEFVEKLSELLQMANIKVESARLVNGETIIVKFECGAEFESKEEAVQHRKIYCETMDYDKCPIYKRKVEVKE